MGDDTINRKVEIYKINYSFLPAVEINKNKEELKDTFLKIINNIDFKDDSYEMKYNEQYGSTVIIELLEVNNKFIFGILAKLENLKGGLLKRLREIENNEVLEKDAQDLGLYLENYTYFYICKETLYCSVLSNSAAPKFKTHFENFLINEMDMTYIEHIDISVVLDEKIDYKINQVTNLAKLDIKFDDTSKMGKRLLELNNTFAVSQNSIRDATISINLRTLPIKEDTKKILRSINDSENEFKKLEVTGFDKDESMIVMELAEKILLKRIDINIDESLLTSFEYLDESLDKIKIASTTR